LAKKFDVAVMHDYFVDRLVHVESIPQMMGSIVEKASSGGGGIHASVQEEVRGGNAVNLAHALARLGLKTLLITHSEKTHEALLRQAFHGLRAEVRIKPFPAGLTVAYEEKVNVMIGDGRGASDFGPSRLETYDWDALRSARLVCSVNWAANRKGTELIKVLRRRLGPDHPLFIDPADFRDNLHGFRVLLAMIEERRMVDWVSMNQFEALAAAKLLEIESDEPSEVCKEVARRLGVVFDMHGAESSYSSEGTRVSEAKVRKIKPRISTGAGDVWDAGAIYGRLKGMEESERLAFANRVARLYLGSKELVPPTLEQALA
jgi:ribokinase